MKKEPEIESISLEEFWEKAARLFENEKEEFCLAREIVNKEYKILDYEGYTNILQEKELSSIVEGLF